MDEEGRWAITLAGYYGRYLRAFVHLATLPATFDLITDAEGVSSVVARIDGDVAPGPASVAPRLRRRLMLPWEGGREMDEVPQKPVVRPLRNFLIIADIATSTDSESDPRATLVPALARHLMEEGYVYVLRPEQREMADDRFGVRYLPLHPRLPAFGLMTVVIVVGAAAWTCAAAAAYPEAQIFSFDLSSSGQATDVQPAVFAWAVAQQRLSAAPSSKIRGISAHSPIL
jgi:hypothetical protein